MELKANSAKRLKKKQCPSLYPDTSYSASTPSLEDHFHLLAVLSGIYLWIDNMCFILFLYQLGYCILLMFMI